MWEKVFCFIIKNAISKWDKFFAVSFKAGTDFSWGQLIQLIEYILDKLFLRIISDNPYISGNNCQKACKFPFLRHTSQAYMPHR